MPNCREIIPHSITNSLETQIILGGNSYNCLTSTKKKAAFILKLRVYNEEGYTPQCPPPLLLLDAPACHHLANLTRILWVINLLLPVGVASGKNGVSNSCNLRCREVLLGKWK
jgi:hypothetical protein